MRHPTSGLSEDDLSRLTGSSTTTSTPSHESDSGNSCTIVKPILNDNESIKNLKNSQQQQNFNNLSYLPEIIDPLEWQKSRKRKERQDSTSSTTQERKLVRSNSEELIISNASAAAGDCEVIRRVSSHEDFNKKPLQERNEQNALNVIQENNNNNNNNNNNTNNNNNINTKSPTIKEMARSRLDSSPARSHRLSPNREYRIGKYRDYGGGGGGDDGEWEHERRRSSERFCKARAQPGRKSGVMKKAIKHLPGRFRERDENVYKYDITNMKYERRGFVSKVKLEERNRKEEAADGEQIPTNDYNDNNLIDFHIRNEYKHQLSPLPRNSGGGGGSGSCGLTSTSSPASNSSMSSTIILPKNNGTSSAEALPWDSSNPEEDQTPVLCRRFEAFDEFPKDTGSNLPSPIPPVADNEPIKSFRTFTNSENMKTREIMQSLPPLGLFQTPEERLKHINKKLTALKKRVTQLEENFERNYGYRPSQVERFNDKQIKNVLAEINKLRKEKHELKSDPMAALGLKISGGMDAQKKLVKMKESLVEIETKLIEKRRESNRSENLDDLTSDQLVQEKTAVQHGLLYFESLYGRPTTREERDIARPLYDRYRIIKRMVARSIIISGSSVGAPELPTILEHEAMAFTAVETVQLQSTASTDSTTGSPEYPLPPPSTPTPTPSSSSFQQFPPVVAGSIDSPSDNSGSVHSTDSTTESSTTNLGENIHTLSIDELWLHLEKARDEKKQLKRTIQEFETLFEEQNGRKMLKGDRKAIEETYAQYKEKKAKVRLLQALIKKHISN